MEYVYWWDCHLRASISAPDIFVDPPPEFFHPVHPLAVGSSSTFQSTDRVSTVTLRWDPITVYYNPKPDEPRDFNEFISPPSKLTHHFREETNGLWQAGLNNAVGGVN